jgi:hypothetical protein
MLCFCPWTTCSVPGFLAETDFLEADTVDHPSMAKDLWISVFEVERLAAVAVSVNFGLMP